VSHISVGVEYGLHCLLFLTPSHIGDSDATVRDLADLQGVPVEFLAKLFTKLHKAGLTVATEGKKGGFRLARAPEDISVLDVVEAIDGVKPLFHCREVRTRCAVFDGNVPAWAMRGTCSIHAVMLDAERKMRDALASQTLADLSNATAAKAPRSFAGNVISWMEKRSAAR